ncbi:MAG: adenylate/guanylate cyclase domain-containing protein, partial [Actinomycetota bacterium]
AELSGLTEQQVRDVHRASGLPSPGEAPFFSPSEIVMFRLFGLAAEVFSRDELLHLVRVMGTSMRRVAEAASEMFLRDVEAPLKDNDAPSTVEMAKANLFGIELAHSATGVFEPMFMLHLREATEDIRRAREGLADYRTLPLTIGFVDLSGFTTRSGEIPPEELLELVMRFEQTSLDVITDHGGRMVKLIGDEVMFSTVAPDEACAIAAELITEAEQWHVGARGGLAYGHLVASGGDLYGSVVNLSARLADIAVVGEVLVDAAVAERATLHAFQPAGRRELKGFADPVRLWTLTREPSIPVG